MNQPHIAPPIKSGRGVDIAFLALAVICLGLLVVLHWRLSSQRPMPATLQPLADLLGGVPGPIPQPMTVPKQEKTEE